MTKKSKTKEVPLVLITMGDNFQAFDELKAAQGIIYYRNHDKTFGLIFGCPQCGHVSTGTHEYNTPTKSLKPSIVCNAFHGEFGHIQQCSYHGYLLRGLFTNVKTQGNE